MGLTSVLYHSLFFADGQEVIANTKDLKEALGTCGKAIYRWKVEKMGRIAIP